MYLPLSISLSAFPTPSKPLQLATNIARKEDAQPVFIAEMLMKRPQAWTQRSCFLPCKLSLIVYLLLGLISIGQKYCILVKWSGNNLLTSERIDFISFADIGPLQM